MGLSSQAHFGIHQKCTVIVGVCLVEVHVFFFLHVITNHRYTWVFFQFVTAAEEKKRKKITNHHYLRVLIVSQFDLLLEFLGCNPNLSSSKKQA